MSFSRAEPSIPCVDRWPEGAYTPRKARAYEIQQQAGEIDRLTITQENGITMVHYLSCIPHKWMLRQLAEGLRKDAEQITIGEMA